MSFSQSLSQKHKTFSQSKFQGMKYGLFTPINYDKSKSYPIIVYLHGSRDTTMHDVRYYSAESQAKNPTFFLNPISPEANLGWGDSWHPNHTEWAAKTVKLIDSLTSKFNIDKKRIYLYGISMGGFGVVSMLTKEQDKFAAGIVICGGGNSKGADKLLSTPIWFFHGSDDDVVPIYLSKDIYNEIQKLGGKLAKYTEYPGVKHNAWEPASKEKGLDDWLFSQTKK